MWNIFTVAVPEITIEGYDSFTNILITLQVNEESKTFKYPFLNMHIDVKEISIHDSLFLTISTQSTEIGQAQVSLEELQGSKELEKIVLITQTRQSPEKDKQKSWQQKKITVGRLKLSIKYKKCKNLVLDYQFHNENDLQNIKEGYNFIVDIVKCDSEVSIDELGMKIFEEIEGKKKISLDDPELLNVLFVGLNEKLKAAAIIKSKLSKNEDTSARLLNINSHMTDTFEKLSQAYEKNKINETEKYFLLQKDYKILENTLVNTKNKIIEQELLIERIKNQMIVLEEKSKISVSIDSLSKHYESIIHNLKSKISNLENINNNLTIQLKDSIQETENLKSEFTKEIDKILSENYELTKSILHLEEKANLQASIIEKQKSELLHMQSGNESLQKQLQMYANVESKLEAAEKKSTVLSEKLQDCLIESSKSICNFNSLKADLSEEKENLLLHAQELQKENMKLQTSLVKQNNDLNKNILEKEEIALQLISVEEILVTREDRHDILQDLSRSKDFYDRAIEKVYRELEFISEYLLGQSEYNLSNVRAMNRIAIIVEDKECEIMVLREMVTDLQKKRAIYIPVRDDPIDGAVADYVNTKATDVPFTREDHGIYVFGSKRVFVRLEHGRIISNIYLVRVGGGYMKIEEFLEVYTPQELERIENRKKEEANAQRNNILGKYAGNIVNERTRGKFNISPDKALKFIKEAIGTPKFTQCIGVPKISPKKFSLSSKSPKREKVRCTFQEDELQ